MLEGLSDALQILVLAIPIVGILLMIAQLFRKGSAWAWRATRRRPARRALALAAGGAIAVALAVTWLPGRNYTPIQPGERGTEGEGIHALLGAVGGAGPLYSQRAASQRAAKAGNSSTRPAPNGPTPRSSHGGQPTPPGPGAPRLATTLASLDRAASHRPGLDRAASHRPGPVHTRTATTHGASSTPAATDPSVGDGTNPSTNQPPGTDAPRPAPPITGFGPGC